MKKILIYIFASVALAGCISNDIPYPVLEPSITALDVEGAASVEIDNTNRCVIVHLEETYDLRKVNVRSVEYAHEITVPSRTLTGVHDLSASPLLFDLTTYDDYDWRILAVRDVERYFTVAGQIGSAWIDDVNHRVIVNVGKDADLQNIEVTSLKLGPKDGLSVYEPQLNNIVGAKLDMTEEYLIKVTAFDVVEDWYVYVETVESTVSLGGINVWTTEAYVNSTGVAGMDNGFQYRESGVDTWTDVQQEDITADGGSFEAHITGLKPETSYEVVAYCGNDRTDPVGFTTAPATQLPNSGFEYVSKVAGADYYKFYDPYCGVEDGSHMFWGSGNGEGSEGVNGSAGLGIVITTVDQINKIEGKQSVCAQTSQMVGMLAAGNLFSGQFAGLVGTEGGIVNFGRPWDTRPKALKLYCKYSTGKMDVINRAPAGVKLTKDDYDRAQIKVALGVWQYRQYGGTPDSPVRINTTDEKTFVDFNTDKSTIANGDLIINHDGYVINSGEKVSEMTDKWIEYTIPLTYRDMELEPTHIIISCAASQFGDYFSGCSSSKLWLDAFELIY